MEAAAPVLSASVDYACAFSRVGAQRILGINLIAPHKSNRVKEPTQDGRILRRYQRRWKVERLNAWLQNFRRLVTRFEHKPANFLGFLQFACALILSRYL